MAALAADGFQGCSFTASPLSNVRVWRASLRGVEKVLLDAGGTELARPLQAELGLSLHISWEGPGVLFCARDSGKRCHPWTGLNARS